MPKIFISYRRADSRPYAGRLYDRLVSAFGAENVFMDVNNDNIPLGRDFRGVLRESVARCDVLLAIIGRQWLTIADENGARRLDNPNDFVRIEIESALQRDTCLVIPLTVEGAYMPAAKDLPDSLRELAFNNGTAVRDDPDFHNDVNRIVRTLENMSSGGTPVGTRSASSATQVPTTSQAPSFDVYEAIGRYHAAFEAREWGKARAILSEIRTSGAKIPRTFNLEAHEKDIQAEIEAEEREREYNIVRRMAKAPSPNAVRIWEALQAFWENYTDYDPDDLKRFKPMKAQDYFERAQQRPDYLGKLMDLNEAILLDINFIDAYNYRAFLYIEKSHYDQAIEDLSTVIGLNPQEPITYNNRGYCYSRKKIYVLAIADFDEAIRLKPHEATFHDNKGTIYMEKKDFNSAFDSFDAAVGLNPNAAQYYSNRGWASIEMGDFNSAINDLTKAIELNPKLAMAYNNLGWAYNEKKEHDKAIAELDKAIELNPKLAMAYNNLGWAYNEKKEHDKAIAELDKAIELDPNLAHAYNNRGHSYFLKGQYEKAKADYEATLRIDPSYPYARVSLEEVREILRQQKK